MKIQIVKTKDYLSKSNLPGIDYVINPYIGCPHACKYCYACFMKRFTNHAEPWGEFIDIKNCGKPINLEKISGKDVYLSSVTDCYNPYESKHEITRNILEKLKHSDARVAITTKSDLILRDLDILKCIKYLKVSFSINTLDENFREDMDRASSIVKRLKALEKLFENGIYTVVFMSPMFPYITDFKEIIEASKKFTMEYWFENLNLRSNYKKAIMDYISVTYPQYYEKYVDIYHKRNISYWNELQKEISIYCKNSNIAFFDYFHHGSVNSKK